MLCSTAHALGAPHSNVASVRASQTNSGRRVVHFRATTGAAGVASQRATYEGAKSASNKQACKVAQEALHASNPWSIQHKIENARFLLAKLESKMEK